MPTTPKDYTAGNPYDVTSPDGTVYRMLSRHAPSPEEAQAYVESLLHEKATADAKQAELAMTPAQKNARLARVSAIPLASEDVSTAQRQGFTRGLDEASGLNLPAHMASGAFKQISSGFDKAHDQHAPNTPVTADTVLRGAPDVIRGAGKLGALMMAPAVLTALAPGASIPAMATGLAGMAVGEKVGGYAGRKLGEAISDNPDVAETLAAGGEQAGAFKGAGIGHRWGTLYNPQIKAVGRGALRLAGAALDNPLAGVINPSFPHYGRIMKGASELGVPELVVPGKAPKAPPTFDERVAAGIEAGRVRDEVNLHRAKEASPNIGGRLVRSPEEPSFADELADLTDPEAGKDVKLTTLPVPAGATITPQPGRQTTGNPSKPAITDEQVTNAAQARADYDKRYAAEDTAARLTEEANARAAAEAKAAPDRERAKILESLQERLAREVAAARGETSVDAATAKARQDAADAAVAARAAARAPVDSVVAPESVVTPDPVAVEPPTPAAAPVTPAAAPAVASAPAPATVPVAYSGPRVGKAESKGPVREWLDNVTHTALQGSNDRWDRQAAIAQEIAKTNANNGGQPQLVTVSNGMLHPEGGVTLLGKKMLPEDFLALYKQYKAALAEKGWLKPNGKVLSNADWSAKKSGIVPGGGAPSEPPS